MIPVTRYGWGSVVEVVSVFSRFYYVRPRAQLTRYIWRRTLPLTRNNEGKLTATLPINYGEKITFKVCSDLTTKLYLELTFFPDSTSSTEHGSTTPTSLSRQIPLETSTTSSPVRLSSCCAAQ